MPKLPFVSAPMEVEGDENKYLWSTRIPESTHQKLSDWAAEYHLNKAGLLREVIYFAIEHWPKIMEQRGVDVSDTLKADFKSESATRKQDRRRVAHKDVVDLLTRAASEDLPPLKAELKLAAKRMAEAWHIPFPPPDLPFDVANESAAYVLKWIKKVMAENKTNRVRLNELNPRIRRFNASELREVVAQLEEHGYIVTSEEITSGPPTLWISLPSYVYIRN